MSDILFTQLEKDMHSVVSWYKINQKIVWIFLNNYPVLIMHSIISNRIKTTILLIYNYLDFARCHAFRNSITFKLLFPQLKKEMKWVVWWYKLHRMF